MKHNLTISQKLSLLVVLMGFALCAVMLVGFGGITKITQTAVEMVENIMYEQQREKLSLLVDTMATSLGESIHFGLDEDKKVAIIRAALSSIRFEDDNSGYFFVYDFSGNNVVHPLRQDFEGTNRLGVTDPAGIPYISILLDHAKEGGGFVQYSFDKPGYGRMPKLAFAKRITGTEYWLATGLYIDNIDREKKTVADSMRQKSQEVAFAALLAALGIVLLLVTPVARRLAKSIASTLTATTQAAQALAAGDYSVNLPEEGGPEQRILAQAFNQMITRVRIAKENLEDQVAARTVELLAKVGELEAANTRIMESIQYASTIQRAILPHTGGINARLPDHFVIWKPKDVIGGDIFWFENHGNSFLLAVIDCTGHGVPGALMTMLASTTLSRVVGEEGAGDPANILSKLNAYVKGTLSLQAEDTQSDDGLDIGLCLVEQDAGRLTFAGARISLLISRRGELEEIPGARSSIGYKATRGDNKFSNNTVYIEPGLCLYMLTDGLSDQVGGERNLPLGMTRIRKELSTLGDLPMTKQKKRIISFFDTYKGGNDQRDDVTIFGFRFGGPAAFPK